MEEIQHDHKDSPTDVAKSKNRRGAAASFFKLVGRYSKGIRNVSKMKQRQLLALELVVCKLLKGRDINYVQEYFIPRNNTAILHIAIEHGVFELVDMCLDHFPDLIWYADTKSNRLLFHASIEHRRVRIFNYIIDLTGKNTKAYAELNVDGGNNSLHLAARKAPTPQLQAVRGPAFQMQLKLQWFKAVEAIVYHVLKTKKNAQGLTPRELFLEKHKDLQKDAKEWMKDTSNSCMVAATLVATVAFAAMITVPSGNNSETGMRVLARKKLFAAFSIANALSMICSAVLLLMFLSIQTSRNRVEDFLESLPSTLVEGLVFLSIAVLTMMISFGTAIGEKFLKLL